MAAGEEELLSEGSPGLPTRPRPQLVVSETAPRPSGRALWRQVRDELRWSLTAPWTWLSGVAANLVLSFVWLLVEPLRGRPHQDWAVVIGTYFAVFILADVTTTNVLGADALRLRAGLLREVPLRRLLLIKNLALMLIVGLPCVIATAVVTLTSEAGYRLVVTLPGVAFSILIWLGVGNLVSVVFPVAAVPLRERWRGRRDLPPTLRWLVHLGLPYALLLVVTPLGRLPGRLTRLLDLPRTVVTRGAVHLTTGLLLWGLGTALALLHARLRKIHLR